MKMITNKDLNRLVTDESFVDKDEDNFLYASISQPPLRIISKNGSDQVMDYTLECPTCKNHVRYGNELFMLSGYHYCIRKGCRERLVKLIGGK